MSITQDTADLNDIVRDIINPTKSNFYLETDIGLDNARETMLYAFTMLLEDMFKTQSLDKVLLRVEYAITLATKELMIK